MVLCGRPIEPLRQTPKPLVPAKKYAAFSVRDSRSIEAAFQKLVEEHDGSQRESLDEGHLGKPDSLNTEGSKGNTSINEASGPEKGGSVKVPVNEDFLFDVDIEARELAPTYWLGPIYDPKSRPVSINASDATKTTEKAKVETSIPAKFELQTQRLFGSYMSNVVTYQDATVAWLLTDDLLSRMSSTIYQRFAAGGHLAGTKVVRGFSEATNVKDVKKDGDRSSESKKADKIADKPRRRSLPPKIDVDASKDTGLSANESSTQQEPRLLALERQLSSFSEDPAQQEEERRQADEDEIKDDYKDEDGQDQAREIEHLILVTHGIGQRLGLRLEAINFIHDVNVLRKTLKSVYQVSPDLQALNSEVNKLPKNCRIQVLPVCWRHLLDFPKQSFKENRKEQDLTDADTYADDDEYPSLENITVEGVPAIRNLITDLALDILLYQSAYREHIAGIVQREANRVYDLFMQRNPTFSGKSVSGLWSNFTSGMASSLLNRSLGLTGEGGLSSTTPMNAPQIQLKPSTFAGTNASASSATSEQDQNSERPPTLIDSELVTLYAGFEKRRKSQQSDEARDLGESAVWMEAEDRSKRLRREEAKVRALNSNGRVDFSVQEGMLDISLWASIASHLSYWADEDVSHFMISQLLSRQRVIKR
ncbi:hypothetical protein P7C71_g4236, partial [Lecanoromycetidae sp. Uapishka_2]